MSSINSNPDPNAVTDGTNNNSNYADCEESGGGQQDMDVDANTAATTDNSTAVAAATTTSLFDFDAGLDSVVQRLKALGMPSAGAIETARQMQSRVGGLQKEISQKDEENRQLQSQHQKEISQKDQEISQKDEEIRHHRKVTFSCVYKNEDGTLRQHPLMYNTTVEPSIGGHIRKRKVPVRKDENGKLITKEIQLQIPHSAIRRAPEGTWIEPDEMTIPVNYDNGQPIHSDLCKKDINVYNEPFEYVNEFGIQELVKRLVMDALSALGLSKYLMCHLEISIYTVKPDMVVVLRMSGRGIFAIEVKSPSKFESDKVFESEQVSGQGWTYLYGFKSAGVDVPIGAIMTYDKIAIITLEDISQNEKHQEIKEKVKQQLSTGKARVITLSDEDEKCTDRKSSPIKQSRDYCSTFPTESDVLDVTHGTGGDTDGNINSGEKSGEDTDGNINGDEKFESVSRHVYMSRVYKRGEVFPALVQALQIAFEYNSVKTSPPLTYFHDGQSLGDRLVFYVGESAFDWKKSRTGDNELKAKVGLKVPNKNTKNALILCPLGKGKSGTVHAACTTGGCLFALKDYHLKPSVAATNAEREKEEELLVAKLFEQAWTEEKRWELLYKRHGARVIILTAKPCLMMPFGIECSSVHERFTFVPDILEELRRFAQNGFAYQENDLRWRHIMKDLTKGSDRKIFLCDLESLEKIPEESQDDERNDRVYQQLESLLRVASDQALDFPLCKTLSGSVDVNALVANRETLRNFFAMILIDGESIEALVSSHASSPKARAALYMLEYFRQMEQDDAERLKTSTPSLVDAPDTFDEESKPQTGENEGNVTPLSKKTKLDHSFN